MEYTLTGMDLLLHRIGWSVQVPARRAAERDEARVAAWREEAWPVVKGRRRTWAPGSASRTNQGLRPPKGRTWGRRGTTPVVTVSGGSNMRISLAALIAIKPECRPRLMVVWDNLNAHVSIAMTELIVTREWLTVCRLPPYAHELNPVELVWSHLKRSLVNMAKRNLAQLTALVKTRLRRIQYRPGMLHAFLASTGLDLTPFSNTQH